MKNLTKINRKFIKKFNNEFNKFFNSSNYFINQNKIIKQLKQFDLKIVIQIIDWIEKIVDFSNKKEIVTNKNYILIDFIFENEENINNKLVNCYFKIFKEIIFISFCNNEFLKKKFFKS